SITIVDAEPGCYDRPPLSKRLFDEDFSLDQLAFATGVELGDRGIATRFDARAVALDAEQGAVTLSDGSILHADTILLATGGRART
ncbi:NAD(P)/FAD-dependent oxidoreductase, partial [Salmonella enterica]|nr:NAD(P)/FAD-dependent oxidoreductase [Salmonella enterica]